MDEVSGAHERFTSKRTTRCRNFLIRLFFRGRGRSCEGQRVNDASRLNERRRTTDFPRNEPVKPFIVS